jgi:ParB/RepB/Spo0J family partition protein
MTTAHITPSSRYEPAMPLAQLIESKDNPRKRFDPASLKELEQSIREKGVLTPLLVRPNGKGHEIAAGHRRYRAAKAAGLSAVPVVVKDMSDVEFLEVLVIENDQREDVHPLEEADGYRRLLMPGTGYDVAKVAARVGRSAKYVYDRMKLLELIPKAQELFLTGKFEAGHAILLARLKPEDQERAIDVENTGNLHRLEGLFQVEHSELPFDDEDGRAAKKRDPYAEVKAVSVREFEAWIHDSIRAEPEKVDAFLFPETASVLEAHASDKLAAILITREYMAGDEVRHAGKDRVYGTNAWKRADGKDGSKTCDRSRIGFVACGPGQGEAFLVCVNKEKCEVHYGTEIRARKKRQAGTTTQGGDKEQKERDRYAEEERRRQEQRKAEEAKQARYGKALPAMLTALAAKIAEAPADPASEIGKFLIARADHYVHFPGIPSAGKLLPPGKSPEDLVRHLAFAALRSRAAQWNGMTEFPKVLKAFGLDYGKLLNAAAPVEKTKVQTPAKKAGKPEPWTCRKCGCTEDAACEGGCSWVDRKKTLCSSCATPAEIEAYGKSLVRKRGKKAARKAGKKS